LGTIFKKPQGWIFFLTHTVYDVHYGESGNAFKLIEFELRATLSVQTKLMTD